MRNRMYGGVRGRKTRVGEKLHRFPPTRLCFATEIDSTICFFQKKTVTLSRQATQQTNNINL